MGGGVYEFCQKVNIWQIYKQARYLILQGGGLSHPTPTPHPPPPPDRRMTYLLAAFLTLYGKI